MTFIPLIKLKTQIVSIATPTNVKNNLNLLTFLTTSKPIIETKGSNTKLPIHQIEFPNPKSPAINMAIAAGLKMCFLSNARKYFEDIATAVTIAVIIKSDWEAIGAKTRNRIKAVMYHDSTLVSDLKILVNNIVQIYPVTRIVVKVIRNWNPVKGKIPRKPKIIAIIASADNP